MENTLFSLFAVLIIGFYYSVSVIISHNHTVIMGKQKKFKT